LLAQLDPTLAASVQAAAPLDADRLLESIARSAGFTDVAVSFLEHQVEIDDLTGFFLVQTATTPWAPAVAALTQAEQQRLAEAFVLRLADHRTAGGHHLVPFCSHELVARKT
jgi:hypothetical protein